MSLPVWPRATRTALAEETFRGSRRCFPVLSDRCGPRVDDAARKWFDRAMSQHAPIDVAGMIAGIQRWVETESPTSDKAAVNRMIDVVQADVANLPVTIERVPGRDGF